MLSATKDQWSNRQPINDKTANVKQQIITKKMSGQSYLVDFVFVDVHGNLEAVLDNHIRIGLSFLLVHY